MTLSMVSNFFNHSVWKRTLIFSYKWYVPVFTSLGTDKDEMKYGLEWLTPTKTMTSKAQSKK